MTFYPDYFDYLGKGLDRKPNVNFKIRDVTDWEANNYITHTVWSQITKAINNEIWSANKT